MAGRSTDIKLGGNKDFVEEDASNIEDYKKMRQKLKIWGTLYYWN